MSMPTEPTAAPATEEWPTLVESGAGLDDTHMETQGEAKPRKGLLEQVRKHPLLFAGIGALAVGGLAAMLGRKALLRAAVPIAMKAAKRRPLAAARFVARHPRASARLAAVGLEPVVNSGLKRAREIGAAAPGVLRELPDALREIPQTVRERLPERLRGH